MLAVSSSGFLRKKKLSRLASPNSKDKVELRDFSKRVETCSGDESRSLLLDKFRTPYISEKEESYWRIKNMK